MSETIISTLPFTFGEVPGDVACRYCGTTFPAPLGTSVATYSMMSDTRMLVIEFAPESGWAPTRHSCGPH